MRYNTVALYSDSWIDPAELASRLPFKTEMMPIRETGSLVVYYDSAVDAADVATAARAMVSVDVRAYSAAVPGGAL